MLQAEVDKHPEAKGFIFDGFPRTTAQAVALDAFMSSKNTSISMMLALAVSEDELIKRLLLRGKDSGRADDSDEAIIRNRISVYNEQTAVAAEYYNEQKKYYKVDGIGSIEDIYLRIQKAINHHSQAI
jgi:adenylate kinase